MSIGERSRLLGLLAGIACAGGWFGLRLVRRIVDFEHGYFGYAVLGYSVAGLVFGGLVVGFLALLARPLRRQKGRTVWLILSAVAVASSLILAVPALLFANLIGGAIAERGESERHERLKLEAHSLLVAIRDFRQKNGAFPETLSALPNMDLPNVSGKVGYVADKEGVDVLIWCIPNIT